ncbi:MAG: hypothetical protein AAF841_07145 [Pseudomonadota bacterium]
MKTLTAVATALLMSAAAPAFAWEGQVVACYDKIFVPAEFKTSKTLHKPARTVWEHKGDQMVEVYYPAMFLEHRTLVTEAHYVKRKAPCRH